MNIVGVIGSPGYYYSLCYCTSLVAVIIRSPDPFLYVLLMFCFQELITAYGHKRLDEIMAHHKKRSLEKQAKKANNQAQSSPVHSMINSSSTLLSQVAKIGIAASRSADNLQLHKRKHTVITEEDEDVISREVSPVQTCDLLQRVIQLGREEARQSESKKPNNLCATMSLPLNTVHDRDNVTDDNLNIPVYLNHGEPQRKLKLNSKWSIGLCGRGDKQASSRRMTNYNGNQYQAIEDDDTQNEDKLKAELSSPDYVTVVMETEESDLDNTMTPDERSTPLTPDLVQFAKPAAYRTMSLQSSASTCSENSYSVYPDSRDYTSVPQNDHSEMDRTPAQANSHVENSIPASDEKIYMQKTNYGDRWKYRTKSVSFDNPSYSTSRPSTPIHEGSRLRRTLSDNDLQVSSTNDLEFSLDLHTSLYSPRWNFLPNSNSIRSTSK